jgi:hypothetical protein
MRALQLASLLVLLTACGGERPLVASFQQDSWHPESFHLVSLSGKRDGIATSFTIILEGDGDRRLVVEGVVETDPQARLVSGRWAGEGGASPRSGVVSRAAVDFLGGQGAQPSLGGQFTLSTSGAPTYRINLPATQLVSPLPWPQ